MKKLATILLLIVATLAMAQKPKVDYIRWKSMTTTERNALTPGASDRYQIYNSTTAQYEYWDGDSWEAFTGSGTTPTLQEVTDTGNTTTNSMTTSSFLKAGAGFNAGIYIDSPDYNWDWHISDDFDELTFSRSDDTQTMLSLSPNGDLTIFGKVSAPNIALADYATLSNKTLVTDERLQEMKDCKTNYQPPQATLQTIATLYQTRQQTVKDMSVSIIVGRKKTT